MSQYSLSVLCHFVALADCIRSGYVGGQLVITRNIFLSSFPCSVIIIIFALHSAYILLLCGFHGIHCYYLTMAKCRHVNCKNNGTGSDVMCSAMGMGVSTRILFTDEAAGSLSPSSNIRVLSASKFKSKSILN